MPVAGGVAGSACRRWLIALVLLAACSATIPLSASDRAYADAVAAAHSDLMLWEMRLWSLNDDPLPNDFGWLNLVYEAASGMKDASVRILALSPTMRFKRTHELYCRAAEAAISLAALYNRAALAGDMQILQEYTTMLGAVRAAEKAAGDSFDSVVCSAGYTNYCTPLP